MNRRNAVVSPFAIGMAPFSVIGQAPERTFRLGFHAVGARPADGALPELLRKALGDPGYGEGKNIADARLERLPELTAKGLGITIPQSLLLRADEVIE